MSKPKYKEGIIKQINSKCAECFVDGYKNPIIIGSKYIKKALSGDKVLIKIKKDKFGFVQKIIERNTSKILGEIDICDNFAFVKPWTSGYYKDFFIPKDKINNVKNKDIVEIEFLEWNKSAKSPSAKVIKKLHNITKEHYLMHRLELPTKFPDNVLQDMNKIEWNDFDTTGRLDMRGIDTFTIDPEGSTDLDDALSIEKRKDGFRVSIHIADVTHYVKPGSTLDREAYHRGLSVYLPNSNIPMLPEKLSSNLCSLLEKKDRLAVSILIDIDSDWNIKNYDISRTVIKSNKKFTYEEAEKHRNDKDSPWHSRLNMLYAIGKKLRNERFKNEITLNLPSFDWIFNEEGEPKKIKIKKRIPTMDLIQSWMLLTNQLVTQKIHTLGEYPWIYRTHNEIYDDNISELKKYLNQLDIKWDKKISKSDNIKNIIENDTTGILPEIIVKKFRPASYSSTQNGHFAIGVNDYAHFTSPIRRYADILIHRILLNAINGKNAIIPNIENDCKHITNKERRAERIEKYANKINCLKFFKNIDYTLQSKIIYFSKKGILVKTDLMIDAWIPSEDLEEYKYDDKQNKWIHSEYNLKLGDIISTKLNKLNWDRNEIYLKIA